MTEHRALDIERHPLEPFLPEGTQVLMLGSFPPAKKRWCMDFFYPNFTNDMWRIMGVVFYEDKFHFVDNVRKTFRREEIISFLKEKHIGLYDTATAVVRTKNTASDKDLQVVEPTDLDQLLHRIPQCHTVITTGQKATDLFTEHFQLKQPKVGGSQPFVFKGREMQLWRMPSSSRAYPMKVEQKAAFYQPLRLSSRNNETT